MGGEKEGKFGVEREKVNLGVGRETGGNSKGGKGSQPVSIISSLPHHLGKFQAESLPRLQGRCSDSSPKRIPDASVLATSVVSAAIVRQAGAAAAAAASVFLLVNRVTTVKLKGDSGWEGREPWHSG